MRRYFEKMPGVGKALKEARIARTQDNRAKLQEIEAEIAAAKQRQEHLGIPAAQMNARGMLTTHQRLEYLVDPGTWQPLHTLYNPQDNVEETTNVIDGLGKIAGRWAVIIGFNNAIIAGAWLAGQPDNILRITNLSRRLNVPLVWLVHCSGVKLTDQEKFYGGRRCSGAPFYRHAELQQEGIPILVGIFGTNPAGGGYHSISPSILLAHKDANIAVGGVGIVSGMTPKGGFDVESLEQLVELTRDMRDTPPGSAATHYGVTGFFSRVYDEDKGVLDGIKEYMRMMPAYDPRFFRVAEPAEPAFPASDLYHLLPYNPKSDYSFEDVLARLVDGSEHMEFRSDYGPEIYTGLVKVDGMLVAVIANRQGLMPKGYPEYGDYPGIGGKLYRQGLIKMSEFVTHCIRDRLPIIWFHDTTGIDVGDPAEKAELLALGQSLTYSVQAADLPMIAIVLRKGTGAAHYIMAGPPANRQNVFTLGTAATEIYVLHAETAAVALYARRAVKDKEAGKPLEPLAKKMNELVKWYYDTSRPAYSAQHGFVDEIVDLPALRGYMKAFVGAVYQNPKSMCPRHLMLLPRLIKG